MSKQGWADDWLAFSLCLHVCVYRTQLEAFVCLIHKTTKSKILTASAVESVQTNLANMTNYSRIASRQPFPRGLTSPSPPNICILPPSVTITDGFIPRHINNASSSRMKLYNT